MTGAAMMRPPAAASSVALEIVEQGPSLSAAADLLGPKLGGADSIPALLLDNGKAMPRAPQCGLAFLLSTISRSIWPGNWLA